MVPLAEVELNAFNLNLPRYIDGSEPEDIQVIDAHLRGGIPNRDLDALDRYWQVFPGIRDALFEPAARDGYSQLRVAAKNMKATIFGHREFTGVHRALDVGGPILRFFRRPSVTTSSRSPRWPRPRSAGQGQRAL
jgi:hypothetical protein